MYLLGPKILAIGDSITYDTTASLYGAYRYYLGEPFSQWFGANVEWVGKNSAVGVNAWSGTKMCGASGQRVDQINSSYDPGGQVLTYQPNLVIIHLGTNDCTQRDSGTWSGTEADSVNSYSDLLTTIFANKPDTIVVACKIIPVQTAGPDALVTSYNAALATMIASHPNTSRIIVSDHNAAFKANVNWSTDYMSNNAHPNDAGEALQASTTLADIQSNVTLMARTPASSRKGIRPHSGALRYTASTATSLGNVELDTTQPWAVSFDLNIERCNHSVSSANGILTLKTDQSTCFGFATLPTAGQGGRGWEFGSSSNFDRFFPSIAIEGQVYSRFARGWHQHTFVFDGVSRTADSSYKYYLDGVNVVLTNGSGLAVTTDVSEIGRVVFGGTAGTFDMANLTIWNGGTAMTAAQALAWNDNYIFPSGPTLIRNFPHTDLSGTTLTDTTGTENGTIGTASWQTSSLPTLARTASAGRMAMQSIPYSLKFNRLTSDRVRVLANANYYTPAETAFTILMRIYLDEQASVAGSASRLIGFGGASINERNFEFYVANANNALQFRITNGTSNQLIGTSSSTYQTKQWYTLGCFYRIGSRMGMIRNASILDETAPTIDLVMDPVLNMSIMSFGGTINYTSGAIGEFLMIDDDISADELAAWHYSGVIPAGATKLIHFRPSEGSGTAIDDLSALNNDGLLQGSTSWTTNPLIFPGGRTVAS